MEIDKKYVPGLFTVLNLFCGMLSIVQSMEGQFFAAAWFIILAVLCDGMDGKLARLTHTETRFGFELDSLCDVVSFGVAPAILCYRWVFQDLRVFGFFIVFFYLMAGVYRLTRFNVIQNGDRTHGYLGLPIPVAAMGFSGFYLFHDRFDPGNPAPAAVVLCTVFALIMVSGVRYDWPRLNFHGSTLERIGSVLLLAGVILMAVIPGVVLFPVLSLYIIQGIIRAVAACIRGDVSAGDLFHPIKSL